MIKKEGRQIRFLNFIKTVIECETPEQNVVIFFNSAINVFSS